MIQELSETPEYKDEVASIGFSTWKEECHLLGIHSVEDYKKSMGRTVIAVQDGLIGQVSIDECDLETHKHLSPWLCSLYVKSPYRLQGIAGRLIEYVVKDYDVLYLWCTEGGFSMYISSRSKGRTRCWWQTLCLRPKRQTRH